MIWGAPGPAYDTDPLTQLLAVHPASDEPGTLIAPSQVAALADWPAIENHAGRVSIVLRRPTRGEGGEWRDTIAILAQLVSASRKDLQFLALSDAAAEQLGTETGLPVRVLPPLPAYTTNGLALILSRDNEGFLTIRKGSRTHFGRRFNLARLRRLATFDADPDDPDLCDIAAFANGDPAAAHTKALDRPVVIVVVPNGIGLGHVTRMMAVARNLQARRGARVVFWSFSRGAGIIARFGFETILRQTAQHLEADPDDWRKWETAEFAALLARLKPELVVQDASALQSFIMDALARSGSGDARLALVRRGMWQKHMLRKHALESEDAADLVIEPADLAATVDRGVTRGRAGRTDAFASMALSNPVTLTRPEEMLDRRRARRALGLGRGRFCLVSLGGDAFEDAGPLIGQLVDGARRAGIRLVWALSPLSGHEPLLEENPAIIVRRIYPLAPFFQAFDAVVSAAGYNSFHELMQLFQGPVLFVPRNRAGLDDQDARAAYAAAQGWAMNLSGEREQSAEISSFMADARAAKTIPGRPAWRDGAAEIADALDGLITAGVRRE
jgi:hypothetical protein